MGMSDNRSTTTTPGHYLDSKIVKSVVNENVQKLALLYLNELRHRDNQDNLLTTGLNIYISRVLAPVWNQYYTFFKDCKQKKSQIPNITEDYLKVIGGKLMQIKKFIEDRLEDQNHFKIPIESKTITDLKFIINHSMQTLQLCKILSTNTEAFSLAIQQLDKTSLEQLKNCTFISLLEEKQNEGVSSLVRAYILPLNFEGLKDLTKAFHNHCQLFQFEEQIEVFKAEDNIEKMMK